MYIITIHLTWMEFEALVIIVIDVCLKIRTFILKIIVENKKYSADKIVVLHSSVLGVLITSYRWRKSIALKTMLNWRQYCILWIYNWGKPLPCLFSAMKKTHIWIGSYKNTIGVCNIAEREHNISQVFMARGFCQIWF